MNISYEAKCYALFLYSLMNGANVIGKDRRAEMDAGKVGVLIGGVFAIFLAFIFMGNLLPTSIGTMANSTSGNAMKNVSAGDKALFLTLITIGLAALAFMLVRSTGVI